MGMRYQARWNGTVIADSDETVVVEGNQYFPVESVVASTLQPSETHTTCHWKGEASYSDVVVDGKELRRRVVLPRAKPGRGEHQGQDRLLARRHGGAR